MLLDEPVLERGRSTKLRRVRGRDLTYHAPVVGRVDARGHVHALRASALRVRDVGHELPPRAGVDAGVQRCGSEHACEQCERAHHCSPCLLRAI